MVAGVIVRTGLQEAFKKSVLLALFLGVFLLSSCQRSTSLEAELNDFAQAFRAASQATDIAPMLALYALEGTTDSTRDMLKNALLYELGLPIRSIQFEPLSGAPEESIRYTHAGTEYGPTLAPSHRMRVSYATEDRFESLFTIGQNAEGAWRIVSSKPLE